MSHGRPRRDLNFFYPTSEYTGYDRRADEARFGVLRSIPDLGSSSLLDIGSGPCNLFRWLTENGYGTTYDAFDIREDSLRVCACARERVHTRVPDVPKDIVCMFTTVSANIGSDQRKNREIMLELITKAKSLNPKHMVISVISRENARGSDLVQMVCYDKAQVQDLIDFINPSSFRIDDESYPSEHIIICSF